MVVWTLVVANGSPGLGPIEASSRSVTWHDATSCHLILRSPVTSGYYRLLPGTASYYWMRQSPRIPGISSDLQLSLVYVRLCFNTLSISTLRTASAYA
eukprot:1355832-Amorphochlora_amoeboformis.AAC.1